MASSRALPGGAKMRDVRQSLIRALAVDPTWPPVHIPLRGK